MEGLSSFLEYGISSGMIECFHLYAIEFLAFLAAYQHSQTDFATQMVIMNMYSFIYMIPQGYSYAASALVGFHLAENKTKTAKRYALLCFL
jgi:Na+-driven multidrug efflux pump